MQAARGAARCAAPSGAAFAPSVPAGRIQPSASISAPCSTRCRSRARRGDEAVARAADGPDAARGSPGDEGVSLDDAATLLTRVESDLQRFKAFEAQNEAGIERLAGIVVPGTVPPTAGAGAPVAGGSPLLSPEQLARVWKVRGPAAPPSPVAAPSPRERGATCPAARGFEAQNASRRRRRNKARWMSSSARRTCLSWSWRSASASCKCVCACRLCRRHDDGSTDGALWFAAAATAAAA